MAEACSGAGLPYYIGRTNRKAAIIFELRTNWYCWLDELELLFIFLH